MNEDTIFRPLSDREKIVGQHEDLGCRECTRTTAIVTNLRLLIRWKTKICFCFTRSRYSSIMLDSIDRIDESQSHNEWLIFAGMLLFFAGFTYISIGFINKLNDVEFFGILLVAIAVFIFVYLFIYYQKKFIIITGGFGNETVRLNRETARSFEDQLIQMIYQTRMEYSTQRSNYPELPQPPESSIPKASTPFIGY